MRAQVPPDADWSTRTTKHFRVTFPSGLPELGREAALRAEAAYRALSKAFVAPPSGRIDVVLTDHTDIANGRASVFPTNHVVVVATPPTDELSLSYYDDWLDLVLVHELAHVYHMDTVGTPGSIFRGIFGRVPVPWPSFPGLTTPSWTREGLAVWYESLLTGAGRNRGTYFDMLFRTAALEGALEDVDRASGESPVWPGGQRPYAYGGRFFRWLLTRYGARRMGAFVHAVAGEWIPYRMNAAAKDAFGVSFDDAWATWRKETEAWARAGEDSLARRAPLTRPEGVAGRGRWSLRPQVSPDGRLLAFTRSDGRSDVQIRIVAPDGSGGRELVRTNGLADLAWAPDGRIVFAQYEYTDRYRLRSDLYSVDPDGHVERITRGDRLHQPDVAPDGATAVAVQNGCGTDRLVEVDLDDGSARPLTPFREGVHWAYPRISPDGRWIAVSRWSRGQHFDVVLLDREGTPAGHVTKGGSVDLSPAWSPDGRWLVWGSDRSGIANLYAAPFESEDGRVGAPVQLTNMATGAAYPWVGSEGRWLYFSVYHADGWRIARIPFRPEEGEKPFPLDPRFRPSSGPSPVPTIVAAAPAVDSAAGGASGAPDVESDLARIGPGAASGALGPYSALTTALPRYWFPDYIPAERAVRPPEAGLTGSTEVLKPAFGVQTSGRDVVGRHVYGVRALVSAGGRVEGALGYRYAGFGNPTVDLGLSQFYDADARGVVGTDSTGARHGLYRVLRDREASVRLGFVRRRYQDVLGLDLGAGVIREHTSYRTDAGSESDRFRALVPDRTLLEGRIGFSGDRTRLHPFSISPEDGVRGSLRLRARMDVGLTDSLSNVAGFDRSYQDVRAALAVYEAFDGPGFAHHVLALRGSAGAAHGPGADAFHFEVGGASGVPEPLTGLGLFGGRGLTFPVRGFARETRVGAYAWSASAEYRFPLLLVHRGWDLVPLHVDRISGSLFVDAGNAWGPTLSGATSFAYGNARRSGLASAGAEIATIVLPFWTADLTVRTGVAVRLTGPGRGGASSYLRLGTSF